MNIHLVFSVEFNEMKEALEEAGHVVIEWDYSLEQFRDFSENRENHSDVALIDGAGTHEKKHMIELLTEIRRNIPDLRLIINFPEELKTDKEFINKLLSLSIYDLYFQDEFAIDDIELWIRTTKTFADYDIDTYMIQGVILASEQVFKEEKQNEGKGHTLFSAILKNRENGAKRAEQNPFRETITRKLADAGEKFPQFKNPISIPKIGIGKVETRFVYPETTLIVQSKGGVGATTLAVHLAKAKRQSGAKVGVLDFDQPFSQAAIYLSMPMNSKMDLTESDIAKWKNVTVELDGIQLLAIPSSQSNVNMVSETIRKMQQVSSQTVICMNHADIDLQMAVMSMASRIIWVFEMTKASIFATARHKVLLQDQGYTDFSNVTYVCNRVTKKDIGLASIEELIKAPVHCIPEIHDIREQMNKGKTSQAFIENLQKII